MLARMRRGERGQSLIEMALVSGLLLLILAGVLDIGRAFNNYIIITNASREGARYASRFPFDAGGIQQAAIQEAASSGVTLTGGNVAIAGLNGTGGSPIRVTITYQFSTVMSGILGFDQLTLVSSTEMVIFGLD
ncbi:MAG: pilus assembly protein [Ardenticatenaceae bacterium]|nr:pilus assembly protein [Ardenticatenaceae bacterium]